MNIFGVGPLELVVILVIALIFVGPERLPRMAADIARTIREIRKYTGSLAAEFDEVVKEFEAEAEQDRAQWKDIGEGLTETAKTLDDAVKTAGASVDEAASAAVAEGTPPTSNGSHPAPAPRPAEEAR